MKKKRTSPVDFLFFWMWRGQRAQRARVNYEINDMRRPHHVDVDAGEVSLILSVERVKKKPTTVFSILYRRYDVKHEYRFFYK